MREVLRWRGVALVAIALLAGIFGYFNSGESIALHLGFFVLYQVPIVVLIFVSFLLGMLTMFVVGLRHDLKVRQFLRERRSDGRPPAFPPYPPPDPDA
jgi:uncharacterized integral membrane protein